VLRTLRRFGVAELDRDELAQEIVISAFLKRRDYDPERGSLLQWLHGFTVKFVGNYWRTRRRMRARLTELPPDLPALTLDPGRLLVAEQLRQILHDELFPQLPFDVLSVVIARELDELTFAAIAEQQQIPISTVQDRYTRGIVALRSAYKRHQQRRQARGLAVLPLALEQILDVDRHLPSSPPALVEEAWRRLQRALVAGALASVAASLAPPGDAPGNYFPRGWGARRGPACGSPDAAAPGAGRFRPARRPAA